VSGVSGEGQVAVGVQFSSGQCALHWETNIHSIEICQSIEDLIAVHGHNNQTLVVWVDEEDDDL
jgi:hypothetical protein